MQGTVFAICGVVLAAVLTLQLLPDEKGPAARGVRLFAALAVLLLVLTPFLRFLKTEPDLTALFAVPADTEAPERVFLETVETRSAAELEAGLAAAVCAEFDLDANDVRVQVGTDEAERLLVRVTLSGKGLFKNPADVARFLREKLDCEDCEVDVR